MSYKYCSTPTSQFELAICGRLIKMPSVYFEPNAQKYNRNNCRQLLKTALWKGMNKLIIIKI